MVSTISCSMAHTGSCMRATWMSDSRLTALYLVFRFMVGEEDEEADDDDTTAPVMSTGTARGTGTYLVRLLAETSESIISWKTLVGAPPLSASISVASDSFCLGTTVFIDPLIFVNCFIKSDPRPMPAAAGSGRSVISSRFSSSASTEPSCSKSGSLLESIGRMRMAISRAAALLLASGESSLSPDGFAGKSSACSSVLSSRPAALRFMM